MFALATATAGISELWLKYIEQFSNVLSDFCAIAETTSSTSEQVVVIPNRCRFLLVFYAIGGLLNML